MLDARFKVDCTHYVSGVGYTLEGCPRCFGQGVYYDISFDPRGRIRTVEGSEKLLQELKKVALTTKGTNPFHPSYGSVFKSLSNVSVDPAYLKSRLTAEALDVVSQVLVLQTEESGVGRLFPDSELIHSVTTVTAQRDTADPRIWRVFLELLTESGRQVELNASVKV